ncbi:MAG: ECF transporter S component [Clostridia bacterium]|nr:ECF transporter S component [Clostridia bacterium]
MEKVESMKKSNRLAEVLSSKKAKYIIGTFLLSGIGIALPRIFHVLAGSDAGATFLPMHIAVLIAALTFGTISSTIVAGSSVVFSYLLTGMPSPTRLPYMLIELLIYALLLSVFNKKFNSYISLILTMVIGRILYAGILFAAVNILGLYSYGISVIESVKMGIPGIIIQLICIPFIASSLKKGIKLNG